MSSEYGDCKKCGYDDQHLCQDCRFCDLCCRCSLDDDRLNCEVKENTNES